MKESKYGERNRKVKTKYYHFVAKEFENILFKFQRGQIGPCVDLYATDEEDLEVEDTRYVLNQMKQSRENLEVNI